MGPNVTWYVVVASFLFGIGALGVMLRRSPLIVLLSLEIMLNGANLALISFARRRGNAAGQSFARGVIALPASQAALRFGRAGSISRRNVGLGGDKLRTLRA